MIPVLAFLLMSNSGGKSGAFSGSPGDGGESCTSCHSGGNYGATVAITHDVPVSGYELNTTYNLTVVGSSSSSSNGFQLTAETNSDNAKIGTLIAGATSRLVNGNANITHTNTTNSSWNFQWKSPATNQGGVTFYAALNAANGNSATSGDQVVTGDSGVINSLSIAEEKRLDFSMYPNPALSNVSIQLPTETNKATVLFYDTIGRESLSTKVSNLDSNINVSVLSKGVYIVKVISGGKIGTQKFVKE